MSKRFCAAVVVLLVLLIAVSYLPVHGEDEIYDTVIRLHVLANSDSEEDQAIKLKVRDAVLTVTGPMVEGCTTREEAMAALEAGRAEIYGAACAVIAEAGREDPIDIRLGVESYPTRTYETCAFPAGDYVSLRVCIGEAEGQNWWCCLFPPLCLSAATAEQSSNEDAFVQVGLSKEQYGVITETKNTKYKVRFKVLELVKGWWG